MYCYHGYHATNEVSGIRCDGVVKPMRMTCVYLFTDFDSAKWYCSEFGYSSVVKVAYMSCDIAGRWKPKYCKRGGVVRLKPGATADYIQVSWVREC